MSGRAPLRLALVGWGAIGQTVGAMLADAADVELVAVGVRDPSVDRPDIPASATIIADPSELAATQPHLVAEAAGRESVGPWAQAALAIGADVIISSVSAFADGALLDACRDAASDAGAQLRISSGALAGVDALSAARAMGIDSVEHRVVKPPKAWADTPAEELCDLEAITAPQAFFTADASATATAFPKNANVAMTTALAGIGPAATTITLVADPTATDNRHEITARGAFGELDVRIANQPLPTNPKTSAMAALSLARAILDRVSPIVV